MKTISFARKTLAGALAIGSAILLAGCDLPPQESEQSGYRGTGMDQIRSPERVDVLQALNVVPEPQPEAPKDGPPVSQIYQNVKVLGHLSEGEFLRIMTAITEWVMPEQGCGGCHSDNLADDSMYTKVVARRMLQMTQDINAKWTNHVAPAGVTCYTCHRGLQVPQYVWFNDPGPTTPAYMGNRNGQNYPAAAVAYSTLPSDPFSTLLNNPNQIRVQNAVALPTDLKAPGKPIQDTETTYALMMHMSKGLGVNCTFCHNSRAFSSWEQSPPQRSTAWYGLRMVSDLNHSYLDPLKPVYPENRLGPTGDAPKANCATCHQGVNKPLYGVSMLKDYLTELSAKK
ncbi:MAG: photosynthetic reaction center cytochrome c subunit [Beijerinckiaceae bacterium]|nr:photosynthetic reaction center cytochrome c subunit [Beijerinckiaceae bacterium]